MRASVLRRSLSDGPRGPGHRAHTGRDLVRALGQFHERVFVLRVGLHDLAPALLRRQGRARARGHARHLRGARDASVDRRCWCGLELLAPGAPRGGVPRVRGQPLHPQPLLTKSIQVSGSSGRGRGRGMGSAGCRRACQGTLWSGSGSFQACAFGAIAEGGRVRLSKSHVWRCRDGAPSRSTRPPFGGALQSPKRRHGTE
mmetsp:Transcript_31730/g.80147  ORF Transcript_31730/g.80147 Transcript_31730/m.80147 type:complete len:200 (-) Transcript_31730:8-607(-)